jgi:predicted Zn-dependent protease
MGENSKKINEEITKSDVSKEVKVYMNSAEFKNKIEKIVKENGSSSSTDLLSTHPNPEERIANFKELKTEYQCVGKQNHKSRYQAMQRRLK